VQLGRNLEPLWVVLLGDELVLTMVKHSEKMLELELESLLETHLALPWDVLSG